MPRTAMLVTPATQEQARRWPALLASALWVLTLLALPMVNWLDQLLRQAGLPELAILEPAAFPLVAAALTAATIGVVLARRRPRHPVGWLLLAIGLSQQFSNLATDYVHYGVMVRPDGLPAATYLTGFYNSGTIVMVACVGFVMLLTPTGSESSRSREARRPAAPLPQGGNCCSSATAKAAIKGRLMVPNAVIGSPPVAAARYLRG
jgi:hypothetical protein